MIHQQAGLPADGSADDDRTRSLRTLWRDAGLAALSPSNIPPDALITSLTDDSRLVGPGSLFVAVHGETSDGHTYIEKAVKAGAGAVVVDRDVRQIGDIPYLRVQDSREALGRLATAFYGLNDGKAAIAVGQSSRLLRRAKLKLIGITGTNGKTTVAWMLRSILRAAGRTTALMGTIEYDLVGDRMPAPLTTPGAVELCHHLSTAANAGAEYAVLEVSSHSLDQRRTDGLRWAAGVFTNLSGDHLDYHGSMEDYARAKRRLFEQLDSDATAVVNGDDPSVESMLSTTRASVVRYGLSSGGLDISASIRASLSAGAMTASGSRFVIRFPNDTLAVRIGLIGRHNVMNAVAAAATARVLGIPPEAIRSGLENLPGVPGRLQRIESSSESILVLVDYAHTDDALRHALQAVRPLTGGRLRCVFGCGGDRDKSKRTRMAIVVQELADVAYVTSDNPRTEDPQAIIDDILRGFPASVRDIVRVNVDRRYAIGRAISEAEPGDTVLIAGKGHENYQLLGDAVLDFDDAEVAREFLTTAKRLAIEVEGVA